MAINGLMEMKSRRIGIVIANSHKSRNSGNDSFHKPSTFFLLLLTLPFHSAGNSFHYAENRLVHTEKIHHYVYILHAVVHRDRSSDRQQ